MNKSKSKSSYLLNEHSLTAIHIILFLFSFFFFFFFTAQKRLEQMWNKNFGGFILPRDSQTTSFRPGIDSQFSHGSDMATECFKMLEFTQKHSPLFIFQVENLFCRHCVFKLRNARHKRLSFSVKRRTCLNFALCVSHRNSVTDMRKKNLEHT